MELFDTHAHLTDEQYDDLQEVLERARTNGVTRVVIPSSDVRSNYEGAAAADPDNGVYYTVGIHPLEANHWDDAIESHIISQLEAMPPGLVAVGEIGLDYHYDYTPKDIQMKVFGRQMDLAFTYDLPVVIHCREAFGDMLEFMQARGAAGKLRQNPGVFHCYSGSPEVAQELLKLGFYLGFDGPITFKNARKSIEVIMEAPRERLVLETDSPYLAPEPRRGRRNEPANMVYIARKLAELWDVTPEEAAAVTTANGLRLYEIS